MKIFDEFLIFYVKIYCDYVNKMRDCLHCKEIQDPNPYHAEGDVWSHTVSVMSVLKYIIKKEQKNIKEATILAVSALLHDVGKLYTRNIDRHKVTFYNHGEFAVQHAIDVYHKFVQTLPEEKQIEFWTSEYLSGIINLVGNHMKFYQVSDKNKADMVNNSPYLFSLFKKFQEADFTASYTVTSNNELSNNPSYKQLNFSNLDIWVYMGLPGSGKDTHAIKNGYKVVSLDKARITAYNCTHPEQGFDYNNNDEFYTQAYNYCNTNNINLNSYLKTQMSEQNSFSVCNTHISIKSRKTTINLIKELYPNATIGCRFMVTPTDICIDRDLKRIKFDKSVGERVIKVISTKIDPPTMMEGFDRIEYIV
jgi:putative nucleotidyltransferase with HDIG domain